MEAHRKSLLRRRIGALSASAAAPSHRRSIAASQLASFLALAPADHEMAINMITRMLDLIHENGHEAVDEFFANPDAAKGVRGLTDAIIYYRATLAVMSVGVMLLSLLVCPSMPGKEHTTAEWMESDAACPIRSTVAANGAFDVSVLALKQTEADYSAEKPPPESMKKLLFKMTRLDPTMEAMMSKMGMNAPDSSSESPSLFESINTGALQIITAACFGHDGKDGYGSAEAANERREAAVKAGALEAAVSILLDGTPPSSNGTMPFPVAKNSLELAMKMVNRVCLGFNSDGTARRQRAFTIGYLHAAVKAMSKHFTPTLMQQAVQTNHTLMSETGQLGVGYDKQMNKVWEAEIQKYPGLGKKMQTSVQATMRGRLMEMMASSGNGPRGGIDPSVVGEDFGAFPKLLEQAGLM